MCWPMRTDLGSPLTAPQNGQKRFLEVGLVNMRDTEKTKNVPEPSQAKEQFAIGAKVNS